MGIPAYFSHILKEHANILLSLQNIKKENIQFDRLYMDCNSIVYDSYREILRINTDPSYQEIVDNVIETIKQIIELIVPSKTTFIAFDGVAPFAKMNQQRLRRFRNEYFQIHNNSNNKEEKKFQTYMITPGTKFMQYLTERLKKEFKNKKQIVSASNEEGEGEHKMMKHLREKSKKTENIAIYGLDSDLIMLSIFHSQYANKIYVFREAPEFFKSKIPITFQHPKEPYFIDINKFICSIEEDVNIPVYDYVFLCFLLGNDFLPHFPILNLRTRALQVIEDVYKNIQRKNKNIIKKINKKWEINWQLFYQFVFNLANIEHELFLQEYKTKEYQERRYFAETTQEEQETSMQHIPQQYRSKELYICPDEEKWEIRYYKALFSKNVEIHDICNDYLKTIEWVFQYYTGECNNWKWCYKYNYPPLFNDLQKYIPRNNYPEVTLLDENIQPYSSNEQLDYVLPAIAKYKEGIITKEKYEEIYIQEKDLQLDWTFCKYLWESHIDF